MAMRKGTPSVPAGRPRKLGSSIVLPASTWGDVGEMKARCGGDMGRYGGDMGSSMVLPASTCSA